MGEREKEREEGLLGGKSSNPVTPPHKRKGLVVPPGCAPAWGGKLIRGWGMDMEAAFIPTPPPAPIPIPGIPRAMGAMPARGTMVMG